MSQTQLQVEITVARPQRQAAHRVGSGAKGRVKRGSRPLHRQNVAVSKCRCLDRFLTSDASDVGGRTFARMTWERIRGHVSLPASKPLRRYNSFYAGTRIRKTYQTFRPKLPMNRHPAGRCAPHRWARPRYDLAEALPVVTGEGEILLHGLRAWASAAWPQRTAAATRKSYRLRSVAIRTRRSSAWAADATAANCPIVAPWSARSTSAVCVVRAVRIRGTSCSRATCSPLTK